MEGGESMGMLGNKGAGGDDKKKGTRYQNEVEKEREFRDTYNKRGGTPRVMWPDLSALLQHAHKHKDPHTGSAHRPPFVWGWSHASVSRGSVLTLSPRIRDSDTHSKLHLPTHSHAHPNNNDSEKDVGALICIVMP